MWVWSLGQEDPLEEGMATHPSFLSWRIPWTEEPGGLQSRGSQRVRHDWSDLAYTAYSHRHSGLLKVFEGVSLDDQSWEESLIELSMPELREKDLEAENTIRDHVQEASEQRTFRETNSCGAVAANNRTVNSWHRIVIVIGRCKFPWHFTVSY